MQNNELPTHQQIQAKIDIVQQKSNTVLFTAKTLFPFTLFPDTVIITEAAVEIIYGLFFFSSQRFPIPITSLKTVSLSTNLLFGTLSFEITGYEQNPPQVSFIPKSQAIKAKNILNGLIMTTVPEYTQVPQGAPKSKAEWKTNKQLEDIGDMGEDIVKPKM